MRIFGRFADTIGVGNPIWGWITLAAIISGVWLTFPRVEIRAQAPVRYGEDVPWSRRADTTSVRSIDVLPRREVARIDASERRAYYRKVDRERISEPSALSLTPRDAGLWETLPDRRRMWRLRVAAPGALTIALVFHQFHLPADAKMYLYTPTGENVRNRPYTAASNPSDGVFA